MLIFLEAIDDTYVDIIKTGPPYPVEIMAMTPDVPEHYVRKEKSKWSDLKKASMLKDAKVRNILYNSLDNVMSNMKNKRAVLLQEYEQFDAKVYESITNIYDRFLTLLNDLSLVGKEYDREDSNTKFLRALVEDWDTQASIIMNQYNLDLLTLDEVYGMLKTRDLEIQQRKNKKGQKMKVVALNAETAKGKEKMSERSRRRNIMEESDTDESSDPDTDTDEDFEIELDDPQVVEMAAMLVKDFRRMRKSDGQYTKGRKFDKTKLTCYNSNKRGHLAAECPKSTGKALVITNSDKEWIDSSGTDNNDECYALMVTRGENASGTDKVPSAVFPIDTNNLSELKTFLYSLHVTFKSNTIECDSLIADNKMLIERNDFLEAELVRMHENEKLCKKAQYNETQINIKYTRLEKVLEKEREVFKTWMTSGRAVHSFIGDKNWKECQGYNKFTDRNINKDINNTTLVKFVKTDENRVKPVYKVGSTSKNLDKKKAEPRVSDKKKEEPKVQ
ncbi:uncharacterized protein LOC141673889 [Apium graveolens]|uniref:uncharacterized protein LOC141673889 n=1 Tax=Apium graveolens TaxID=4045 RepID=UPI003D79BA8D